MLDESAEIFPQPKALNQSLGVCYLLGVFFSHEHRRELLS